jgi:glycerate kinase
VRKVVLAAPDKFRGTARASEVARAVADGARRAGWRAREVPMSDGGEGLLEVLGGLPRRARVTGPLGAPVEAEWRLRREGQLPVAVVESARASGLALVGGPQGNDPVAASTVGTGELVLAAVRGGARRVVVGCGGSATTDGGLGAVRAIGSRHRLGGAELLVACDVTTRFLEAAAAFAPQKGASPAQVRLLERRLERVAELYREEFGVDVTAMPGSGAAGGLAGGLAALGAELVPGVELVAEEVGLREAVGEAGLVVTGEGRVDRHSAEGKVVGAVVAFASEAGVPVLVVAGEADDEGVAALRALAGAGAALEVVSLAELAGLDQALERPCPLVADVVARRLADGGPVGATGRAPG